MIDLEEPTRIHGRYLLQERIARGGSAQVWRARDEELDREVAVKLLHPHLVPDETARRRLAAEGRIAAGLTHPGIVQTYEVRADDEIPALVMELIDGESLHARLAREGTLSAAAVASIGADLAEALAEAHRHGVVHRDVKPSNVLLDRDGHAHLVDFGIAHSLEPAAERLTQTGTVVGTPAYISPEQLQGAEVTPRTDLFGLGSVMFEALVGHPPFTSLPPLALAQAHAAGPPPMPGVDPALADIVRACLANAPGDRPPDAELVAATLRAIPSMNAAQRDADTQVIPVVAPPAPLTPEERLDGWWRGAWPVVLGAAGLFVTVLLVAAILGSGKPAEGAAGTLATPTPAPWLAALMSDYAAACNATLDTAQIAGLSQADAEARVADLVDACSARTASPNGGEGGGHGKGGKGKH